MVEKLLQKTVEEIRAENSKLLDEKVGYVYNSEKETTKKNK